MIRKSATELSRAEIDSVPDNAAVVAAEAPNPGHDHSERTQVFHDKPRSRPAVPAPELSTAEDAPALSLSAPGPELAVIDGHAETATVAETGPRSEEHTSELQSRFDLVCRLLLEKKNQRLDPAQQATTA